MIDFVSKKWFYFAFSTLILIPGLVSLAVYKLNLGIDFVGGTLIEIRFEKAASKQGLESAIEETGVEVSTVQTTDQNTFLIRTKPLDEEQHKKLIEAVGNKFGLLNELRRETVGPTIGAELLRKAVIALVLASVAIVFYVAWAFRKVPKPASSWQFGISAIVALLHDVFVVVGVFSILGHFFAVEVDALLVTALLTIIGFSVHDTIVVFDRIRENLLRETYTSFADTVNHSIMQTLARSLNTSLTVVFVLLAVLLFGGSSIRWFTVALLIGVISGTYSSIFNASQVLVAWQEWGGGKKK
ncbi:MAG: protein-export membrane protein SecF [Candidatus Woykebacteria bacterium RIFCSPHIGHO2_01_FULL_39_12]|uniref:Protein-export membrane protein SecF n=1 Tax=Candidatus Woykebacteria bacterium RIFCSPHIGHO2_01_FULL_39_12 TaxID=1802599 RepID=A0A1G1WK61_9BACT|nr:MAG: protein-export membrane protein SecF [Candidatus Woykebacteria bacterium RIFCSPHIGHO2_01_FULL_39_12]